MLNQNAGNELPIVITWTFVKQEDCLKVHYVASQLYICHWIHQIQTGTSK